MTIHILDIPWDAEGVMVSRPNRFLALTDIHMKNGTIQKNQRVHVHDPGRLKEILYPGNKLRLQYRSNPKRKTQWDVVAGYFHRRWVLINTQFHRPISELLLRNYGKMFLQDIQEITPEVTVDHSRLDFVVTDSSGLRTGIEVKGCTLVQNRVALFPDA
ncbi:MAG: DNA/RNA nuclease SfsA, partial [Candidatus Heimdallarchaeota archaeon]|nr:DNA/RNA nuclease SfsA [Candidatus Heimdallarchaeota archaeon]